jgi:hypothetical protein
LNTPTVQNNLPLNTSNSSSTPTVILKPNLFSINNFANVYNRARIGSQSNFSKLLPYINKQTKDTILISSNGSSYKIASITLPKSYNITDDLFINVVGTKDGVPFFGTLEIPSELSSITIIPNF